MNATVSALTSTAIPEGANPNEMRRVFDAQLPVALQLRHSSAKERIEKIKRLRSALLAERDALYSAFASDYRKPSAEVEVSELLPVFDEMRHAIGSLKSWMKPRKVAPSITMLGTSAWVEYQPKGRVLIIAPWNYPLSLCFGPLVSAIAAGNTAIVKPSEMAPAVSAVMARILGGVFEPDEVALFEGATETSQALLAMPFDHIFFTGSPAVGKIVMAAAARHLASVTLELGGRSPAIVDEEADVVLAAQTLMWGKFLNNGQTCVAPDHIYVHESVKAEFITACRKVLSERYGATATERKNSPDLARMINTRHAMRVAELIADARRRGASVLTGGDFDTEACYVAPTLLGDVPADAAILSEEVFGPVLAIISYTDTQKVIDAINDGEKPLALYAWSRNREVTLKIIAATSSGGACINHCVAQFAHGNLPFGGVNNSGIGNAHGIFGFKAFSHERAVLRSSPLMLIKLFFPPYTDTRKLLIRKTVDMLRLPML